MGSDDELSAPLRAAVDLHEQRELSLGRQGCLGLIEQVDPVFPEGILYQRQKALTVGLLMEVLRDAAGTFAVFFLHGGNIVEALRPEEIPIDRFAGAAGKTHSSTQLGMRVVG